MGDADLAKSAVLQTLNDQATHILRERIITGELAPGSRILEIELAEELGISRGTLRTALQQLVFEGLLVQRRFKSTYVTALTARDAYEVYTLRNALEAMATRIVASQPGDRVRSEVKKPIDAMRHAADSKNRPGVVEADFAFHRCILQLSGHSRLQAAYSTIEAQTRLFLRVTATLDYNLTMILQVHQDLADAIIAGDVGRAEALAREHNTSDGEKMARMLQQAEAAAQDQRSA
jgi:DNA-binding GntR family transcriptional regulator